MARELRRPPHLPQAVSREPFVVLQPVKTQNSQYVGAEADVLMVGRKRGQEQAESVTLC